MRLLLVDNYDSFTFNLYQLAADVFGENIRVVPNDANWETVLAEGFDAAIISPGPGHPAKAKDFGISRNVLELSGLPTLGVCLGHQGIYNFAGGLVTHAPVPMHGRISEVYHSGEGLFKGIPNPFKVVRYHSLIGVEPLPAKLKATARTSDGLLMALEHLEAPVWGVQFHPESILTEHGRELLQNFKHLAEGFLTSNRSQARKAAMAASPPTSAASSPKAKTQKTLFSKRFPLSIPPVEIFERLFAHKAYSFWLDSRLYEEGKPSYSFMGGYSIAEVDAIRYHAATRTVERQIGPRVEAHTVDLFEYLKACLDSTEVLKGDVPFSFVGGMAGYLGYELKSLCGTRNVHTSQHPDAYLFNAHRFIAIDHAKEDVYLAVVGDSPADESVADEWFCELEATLASPPPSRSSKRLGTIGPFVPWQSHDEYLRSIDSCLAAIRDGETYEVCLTNQLTAETDIHPFDYYKLLRTRNPAPYASYIHAPELSVACSSPERFLKITDQGEIETKPIKGTASRGLTETEDQTFRRNLAEEEKSRSENLMICDLLRNDLGRVCRVGSVQVPKLMHLETYATVHQLVSTIIGRLADGQTSLDCIRAAFPGGSITGAPKIRTMEIIDSLERTARGVYTGAIGFISLSGAADLNIVIRTAVFSNQKVQIGVGGAIVALSDKEAEWQEILLKAQALLSAFAEISGEPIEIAGVTHWTQLPSAPEPVLRFS